MLTMMMMAAVYMMTEYITFSQWDDDDNDIYIMMKCLYVCHVFAYFFFAPPWEKLFWTVNFFFFFKTLFEICLEFVFEFFFC